MNFKVFFQFILCITVPLAVGAFAGYLAVPHMEDEWFVNLIRPSFYPPDYLFGPIWAVLYFLMGISLFVVVFEPKSGKRTDAILAFVLQLILNFWWSVFFFRFKRPDVATGEMVILWFAIVFMILMYRRVKPAAAWLQIPYLLWVTYALVLNVAIWSLNQEPKVILGP